MNGALIPNFRSSLVDNGEWFFPFQSFPLDTGFYKTLITELFRQYCDPYPQFN